MELKTPRNGDFTHTHPLPPFPDDLDSTCSTPYVSAPSSPGRAAAHGGGYFFSAPASPMHFVLSTSPSSKVPPSSSSDVSMSGSFEFNFDAGSMISADELFHNGQIRPMKLSLAPLLDVEAEDEEEEDEEAVEVVRGRDLRMRSRSLHRRTRSMSPMRNSRFEWREDDTEVEKRKDLDLELDMEAKQAEEAATASATASRSSSGRNSKRWVFLKDLLYRSKSEGRGTSGKEKFWSSLSFSPSSSKDKTKAPPNNEASQKTKTKTKNEAKKAGAGASSSSKPTNGVGKRRGPAPSPHERLYTANRAVAEEMKKRTFLPYRQGLLGCLGFSSRSYGAVNGFARVLNPVSSR